jgi:hypothetical protein
LKPNLRRRILTKDEALKLALHELEGIPVYRKYGVRISNAITAIKEALAQPVQEPVAWYDRHGMVTHDPLEGIRPLYTAPPAAQPEQEPVAWGVRNDDGEIYDCICPEEHADCEGEYTVPLYTTPPKRTWVGLTDEDCKNMSEGDRVFVMWVEAKLKEKNA